MIANTISVKMVPVQISTFEYNITILVFVNDSEHYLCKNGTCTYV